MKIDNRLYLGGMKIVLFPHSKCVSTCKRNTSIQLRLYSKHGTLSHPILSRAHFHKTKTKHQTQIEWMVIFKCSIVRQYTYHKFCLLAAFIKLKTLVFKIQMDRKSK